MYLSEKGQLLAAAISTCMAAACVPSPEREPLQKGINQTLEYHETHDDTAVMPYKLQGFSSGELLQRAE